MTTNMLGASIPRSGESLGTSRQSPGYLDTLVVRNCEQSRASQHIDCPVSGLSAPFGTQSNSSIRVSGRIAIPDIRINMQQMRRSRSCNDTPVPMELRFSSFSRDNTARSSTSRRAFLKSNLVEDQDSNHNRDHEWQDIDVADEDNASTDLSPISSRYIHERETIISNQVASLSKSDGSLNNNTDTHGAGLAGMIPSKYNILEHIEQDEKIPNAMRSAPSNELVQKAWNNEKDTVKRRKDEIDNMLVFAALFSAVLTSFIIDSYQSLKPQVPNESTLILRQISVQLSSFISSSGFINSTSPSFSQLYNVETTAPATSPTYTTVLVNALWFFALVCSLVSTSLGIAIRQWLNHHEDVPVSVSSEESIRIWLARRGGYASWHVTGLLDLLPVLLQVSLVVFLLGLVILLRSIHQTIANIVLAQTVALWVVLLTTTVAPVLFPRCTYKSPQSLWLLQLVHVPKLFVYWTMSQLARLSQVTRYTFHQHTVNDWLWPENWVWPKNWKVYEKHETRLLSENFSSIASADEAIVDDEFLVKFVHPAIKQLDDTSPIAGIALGILQRRADTISKVYEIVNAPTTPTNIEAVTKSIITLGRISIDVLARCRSDSQDVNRFFAHASRFITNLKQTAHDDTFNISHYLISAINGARPSPRIQGWVVRFLFKDLNDSLFSVTEIKAAANLLIDIIPTMHANAWTIYRSCRKILDLSSRLPKSDADLVYASYGAVITSSLERITADGSWDRFWDLLDHFSRFADGRVAAQILTEDMLKCWKELAASCNYEGPFWNKKDIAYQLEWIRALADIPAPRVDDCEEIDNLMHEQREDVARVLPAWVVQRNRRKAA